MTTTSDNATAVDDPNTEVCNLPEGLNIRVFPCGSLGVPGFAIRIHDGKNWLARPATGDTYITLPLTALAPVIAALQALEPEA